MSIRAYSESSVPVPEGFTPFPNEKVNHSVAELLQESCERYADRVAIEVDGRKISFRELDRLTNQLANNIIAQAGDKEEPVAVLVEQGVSQIIAILGVLKSGKIYSAMDLSNPPERLTNMLADFGARLIISNSSNSALARSVVDESVSIIEMDKLTGGNEKVFVSRSANDPVAVYYTSGSTGQPKGVVYKNRGILHFVRTVTNRYCMNPDDKQTLPFSCSYAWSISPVFATLLCGGTLYPVDLRNMGMQDLAAFVEENQITILQLSTGMLRSFMGALDKDKRHFPHLKILITGGEPMQSQDAQLWKTLFSQPTVLGCTLASSEATLITFNTLNHDSNLPQGILPVGFPVPYTEVLIVDEERRPLPHGETGEVAIRSEYLANGYWNKPELTDAVFQKDTNDPSKRIFYSNDLGRILPDGMVEHLGRKDSFAKIRAYSVDLLEVEQAIYDLHDVKHVVVAVIPARHDPEQKQLVAYLAVEANALRDAARLREALAKKLPSYMIPSFFLFLDSMPLTINGKVDKKALPPVDHTRELQEHDLPLDDIERRLVTIWREVLNTKQVGVNDNFFDLGGDSLLATHLLLTIEKAFSKKMPLVIISKASNISQQAEFLRNGTADDFSSVLIPIQTTGSKNPLFCIGGKGGNPIRFHHLLKYFDENQPVYFFRSRGFEQGERIQITIEEIAADYLREVKRIQPAGPYRFLGESSGGLIAYEMAQQLHKEGHETKLLGMLDTYLAEMKSEAGSNSISLYTLLKKHTQTLTSGGFNGLITYFKYYLELWKFKLSEARDEKKRKQTQLRHGDIPDVFRRVEEANLLAGLSYKPKPYSGRVAMFSATRQLALEGNSPDHGWEKVGVGELIVHSVDCYHGNILFEPFVQQVAKELNQYLTKD